MFIDNAVKPFPKSEVDLFQRKLLQNNIESSEYVEYRPFSTGLDDIVEFIIPASDFYVDLSLTKLYLKVKIIDPTGNVVLNEMKTDTSTNKETREGTHIAPCCNFLGSLFKQVVVYLRDKPITAAGNCYYYKSYLEKLLNYGSDAKYAQLASGLFIEDATGKFNTFDNTGAIKRMKRISSTGSIELFDYLHLDIGNNNALMMNNLDVSLKLYRNHPSFSLFANKDVPAGKDYKIQITDAVLHVRKVKTTKAQTLGNEVYLTQKNARYFIERTEIKTFIVPTGSSTFSINNCFISTLPKRVLFMQISEKDEFNYRRNPMNLQHFNLSSVHLVGDTISNIRPITMNFAEKEFMKAYMSLNEAMNFFFKDTGAGISATAFEENSFIVGWDMTPDFSASDQAHMSIPRSGVLRLDLQYDKVTTENIKVILFAEYDSFINIDTNRNIYTDYAC